MNTYQWRKLATVSGIAIASAVSVPTSPSLALTEMLSSQKEYQIAQIPQNCRQVTARSGLYVRREPTVYSEALGIIRSGRTVTIENQGTNGWAPISAPLAGYVYAGFLGACQDSSPPPSNCRRVQAEENLPVRQEPTVDGAVIGMVSNGRRVSIVNRGVNGWVPITVPLTGYVSSDYLAYCR